MTTQEENIKLAFERIERVPMKGNSHNVLEVDDLIYYIDYEEHVGDPGMEVTGDILHVMEYSSSTKECRYFQVSHDTDQVYLTINDGRVTVTWNTSHSSWETIRRREKLAGLRNKEG